jgi:thiamine-monophosphate kinase
MDINLENSFISLFKSKYIGDDGALIGDLVYSNDAFFENIHFKRSWMSLDQIGYKAMMVNISDAIAMNATPKYALLSIAMPKDLSIEDTKKLHFGINKACKKYDIEVIGGDTISNTKLDLSITIISKCTKPLFRKGVTKGDIMAYTGNLGDSLTQLNTLMRGGAIGEKTRFMRPKLRASFVREAREHLSGGMDISDGLFFELERLSKINKVGFEFLHEIPHDIGCSGEEYEMLVAFPAKNLDHVKKVAKRTKTKLNVFAKAVKGSFECNCKPWHF